ncbi:hypothetical protein GEMRC1_002828 [Eukaryota sp. GEM-RC1]
MNLKIGRGGFIIGRLENLRAKVNFLTSMIELNVGGKLFATSKDTLSKIPDSYFASLSTDSDIIFIDRDFTHFQEILNFVRDGSAILQSDQLALQEIKAEAEFYKLPGLVSIVDEMLKQEKEKEQGVRTYKVFEIAKGCSSNVERITNQYATYGYVYETTCQSKSGETYLVLSAPKQKE